MDRAMLKELGIIAMREALSILKQAKEPSTQTSYAKTLSAKLPQFLFERTPQQFRKFQIDWGVFTRMTGMPTSQTSIQLYNCADESVQNAIINTYPKFFTTKPDRLVETMEALVTQKSNPMVHWITFASMSQHEDKPIQQYLRATATDCNFSCSRCEHDLLDIYIKDQFIRGIATNTLQNNLLAKARVLKSFEQNICHAEAFELTLQDQTAMTDTSDVATVWMSTYHRQKNRTARTNRGNIDTSTTATHNNNIAEQKSCQVCIGCGSHQHGTPGTSVCHLTWPTWGWTCNTCGKPNHFSTAYQTKKEHC